MKRKEYKIIKLKKDLKKDLKPKIIKKKNRKIKKI